MDEQKVAELNRIIRECKHIVFFGGAGVSTESGIPDFRSKDGLYNQHDVKFDRYSPEYLLSIDCLIDHPEVFYEFYRQKLNTAGIEPNRTHYKLAEMEKAGKLDGIILYNNEGEETILNGETDKKYLMGNEAKSAIDFILKREGTDKFLEECQLMNEKVLLCMEKMRVENA